ncbi:ribulose-phosphate 3-epimerase [Lentisphaerota bacterium WC36G]|nr:ribulose-phosphate 3-epimerase [Lentisphaerae bacterium WC36]
MNKINKLSTTDILVAPSILAADFANLGAEIANSQKANSDMIHLDVMDGHFVPNLTMGPALVSAIRSYSTLLFDAHLMISNPLKYINEFVKAGADHITFHVECDNDINEVIAEIKKHNISAGISLKPDTDVEEIIPYLKDLDLVLIMTVEPGFGGQSFMHDQVAKIERLKEEIAKLDHDVYIQVDGGIDAETAKIVAKAGATVMVAGTSVYRNELGMTQAVAEIKNALN